MPPAADRTPSTTPRPLTPMALDATPEMVLARWPQTVALACLMSPDQGPDHPRNPHGRWSLFAPVGRTITTLEELSRLGPPDPAPAPRHNPSPVERSGQPDPPGNADLPPFGPGWIGVLGYDLGRQLEPRAAFDAVARRGLAPESPPPIWLSRCDRALIFDHHARQWWSMDAIAPPHVTPGNADTPWYRDLLPSDLLARRAADATSFRRGPLTPDVPRHTFEAMVQRVLDYIHAGDCYQVNLAHRLRATFEGDARALTLALLAAARPWYGCHLDIQHDGQRWTLSGASPERFLEISPPHADGTRTITTRPMKGTRRASDQGSHADLNASAKDRAELAMIVDLMRNDLGRVATLASVQVSQPRIIEEHGTGDSALLQTTATINATLAPSYTLFDILRATVPPGSITGAPKIRAMQIIDELEHAQRGPYCGSVGYIGDDGSAQLNVAIRTALIAPPSGEPAANQNPSHYAAGSTLAYWVGAGIVADSTPASEWEETLAKASAIEAVGTGDWGSGTGVGERQ